MSDKKQPIYQAIAGRLSQIKNCKKSGNLEWEQKADEALRELIGFFRIGSGFDVDATLERDKCNRTKIVITGSYHTMNEAGYYDGWVRFQVTATGDLVFGVDVKIKNLDKSTKRQYRDHFDYIVEVYHDILTSNVVWVDGGYKMAQD